MGIETTTAACIDLGVNYLRMEIDNSYIQIAEYIFNERNKIKKL